MSKTVTQQEIAAPEAASDIAQATNAAAAEPQVSKKKIVREKADAREKTENRFFTSRRITQFAMFVAMALVMKLIGKSLTITPTFTVTFIYLPWLIGGVVLGPIGGMIVGAISDVLGNLIFGTPFIPLTFVSNTLFPLPIALAYKFLPIKNDYVKCSVGAVCSLLICTLGIGSLALYTYYGYFEAMSYPAYLLGFRLPQVGVFAVNLIVLLALVKPLQHVGIFPSKAADGRYGRILVFAVSAAVFTAIFVTAVSVLATHSDDATALNAAPVYGVISVIYAALMCQAGLLITKKGAFASAVLKAGTILLLYVALAIMLLTNYGIIEYQYLIFTAVGIAAIIVIVRLVARRMEKQGEKHT